MIPRKIANILCQRADEFPVLTITGPRQSGKTTLVKASFPGYDYVNLEDPETREIAATDYKRFFSLHKSPLIIDEIQRLPFLTSVIQTLVDINPGQNGQFVLTGSHQPHLKAAVSQSLAGRCAIFKLLPLEIGELRAAPLSSLSQESLILRGGMPRLATSGISANVYYRNYLQTYLERDVSQVANIRNMSAFRRFLVLLAGRIGQLVNLNSLSGEVGVSHTVLSDWLNVLEASFIVFRLYPYFANVGKRMVKTPKLYFTETALAASLLGLKTEAQVARDPLRGSLFENLMVSEIVKQGLNRDEDGNIFFFRTNDGLEVDLVRDTTDGLQPIEIKSASTWSNSLSKGIGRFLKLFPGAVRPTVIYGGTSYPSGDTGIDVVSYLDFAIS